MSLVGLCGLCQCLFLRLNLYLLVTDMVMSDILEEFSCYMLFLDDLALIQQTRTALALNLNFILEDN